MSSGKEGESLAGLSPGNSSSGYGHVGDRTLASPEPSDLEDTPAWSPARQPSGSSRPEKRQRAGTNPASSASCDLKKAISSAHPEGASSHTKVPNIIFNKDYLATKVPIIVDSRNPDVDEETEPANRSAGSLIKPAYQDIASKISEEGRGVKKFSGKIVYNPDGSAYIIDDSEMAEDDDFQDAALRPLLQKQKGSIVEKVGYKEPGCPAGQPSSQETVPPYLEPTKGQKGKGEDPPRNAKYNIEEKQEGGNSDEGDDEAPSYPQIANAIYVTKSTAYYKDRQGPIQSSLLRDKLRIPETPIVHSYRVFSVRGEVDEATGNKRDSSKAHLLPSCSSVPVKPILMCFLCKLSFGYTPSFISHCSSEHNLEVAEEEKAVLKAKSASAIIQAIGKDKAPLLSFLQPIIKKNDMRPPPLSPNSMKGLMASASADQHTSTTTTSLCQSPVAGSSSPVQSFAGLPPPPPLPPPPASVSSSTASSPSPHLPFGSQPQSFSLNQMQQCGLDENLDTEEKRLRSGFERLSNLAQLHSSPSSPSPSLMFDSFSLQTAILRNSFDALTRKSPTTPLSGNDPNAMPGPGCLSPLSMAAALQGPLPPNFPSNANMLQGNTIGACPEHMNGRQQGVECTKCDIILSASRLPGGIGWNAAKNTCKTLKCPKCNWHYKYQETLEIHMKEKHPESESSCLYCVTGQPHPRLARGETYTCGYKPYRCEVCNYSTTTKGNLSIHMQSDKHLNNMQELQNGAVVGTSEPQKLPQSPLGRQGMSPSGLSPGLSPLNLAALQKVAKPNWRCDVCNYETNVSRNLRIHMTSEKHTHNIMVLQQNLKHIQQFSPGGGNAPLPCNILQPNLPPGLFPPIPGVDPHQMLQLGLGLPCFPGMPPLPGPQVTGSPAGVRISSAPSTSSAAAIQRPGSAPGNQSSSEKVGQHEAAMADLAYLQALMMQMISGAPFPPGNLPPDFCGALPSSQGFAGVLPIGLPNQPVDLGINPESLDPPPEPAHQNPSHLFNCCICRDFTCDSVESMSHHLTVDRTRARENEVSVIINGNFICKLCSYKTNLKANFQLHCKTDKHLQRLNHVNHIKEGGQSNEWRLKFLNVTNPVQLRCNACDYYTNSLHKLQLHVVTQRHEISAILFSHLQKTEQGIPEGRRLYNCILCKFSAAGKLPLMAHVRSLKHLQMEQVHQLQKRSEGNVEQSDIGDIFQVAEGSPQMSPLLSEIVETPAEDQNTNEDSSNVETGKTAIF